MSGGTPQWYWNAASDPFAKSSIPDWKPYSAEDNNTIEERFKSKVNKAELKNHTIYFNEKMQVNKNDFNRQRPVKREEK